MKHTMLRCLSLVMVLATLVSVCALPAIAANVAAAAECNHIAAMKDIEGWDAKDASNPYFVGEQKATCQQPGGAIYKCVACEEEFLDTREGKVTPATDHTWGEWKVTVTPEGTKPGEKERICSVCKDSETEELPAPEKEPCADHGDNLVLVSNTATCSAAGVKKELCSVCGHTVTTPVEALGHDWDVKEITVKPTCGTPGTAVFECANCHETVTDVEVEPASGEHYWKWLDKVEATCANDGNTAGYVCVYCEAEHPTEPSEKIEKSHNWVAKNDETHVDNDYTLATADKCKDGAKWEQCTKCQEWRNLQDTEDYTPTGKFGNHYYVKKLISGASVPGGPNETEPDNVDGNELHYEIDSMAATLEVVPNTAPACEVNVKLHCTVCDETFEIANTKALHVWIETAPTCVDYGFKTCKTCGATEGYKNLAGQIINPSYNKGSHQKPTAAQIAADPTLAVVTKPTCTERGYTTYVCQVVGCGMTFDADFEEALKHDLKDVAYKAPTCTEPGNTAGVECQRENCTYTTVEPIKKLEHDYQEGMLAADCSHGNRKAMICTRCGDVQKILFDDNQKDESKHNYVDADELENVPTCMKPGSVRQYCTICKEEAPEMREIPATGHSFFVDGVLTGEIGTVPAICSAPGHKVYLCTNENCDFNAADNKPTGKYSIQIGGVTYQIENKEDGNTYLFGADIPLANTEIDRYNSHFKSVDFTYNAATGEFKVTYSTEHDADGKTGTLKGFVLVEDPKNPGTMMGSCSESTYYEYTCSTCTLTYNKKYADAYGLTGEHIYGDPLSAEGATCSDTVNIGEVCCERCAVVLIEGTPTVVNHNLDKTGEYKDQYKGKLAATCELGGFDEQGWCLNCKQLITINPTEALGHTVTLINAQAVACGVEGWDAHYGCSVCKKVLNNEVVNATELEEEEELNLATVSKYYAKNYAAWVANIKTPVINGYLAALTHKYASHVVASGCGTDGYTWFECTNTGCDSVYIKANYDFGFANHRFTDETNITDKVCVKSYYLCAHDLADGTPCPAEKLDHAAGHHVNAENETVDTCENFDDVTNHTCASCDVTFTLDSIHAAKDNDAFQITEQKKNCVQEQATLKTCKDCGHVSFINYVPGYGEHAWSTELVGNTTVAWDKVYSAKKVCDFCGEEEAVENKKLAELFFFMETNGMDVKLVNGGQLAVTVKMMAPSTAINIVRANIIFDTTVLTWTGKADVDNVFGSAAFTYAYSANDATNVVTIVANSSNTADGKVQNVVVNGTETLATLYFTINPKFYDKDASNDLGAVVGDKLSQTAITFGDIEVAYLDETGATKVWNYVAADEVTAADVIKVDTENYDNCGDTLLANEAVDTNGAAYVLDVYKLGDVNEDGVADIVDFNVIRAYIVAAQNEYDARLDLNRDGKVDLADFIVMQKYLVNELSYDVMAGYVAD